MLDIRRRQLITLLGGAAVRVAAHIGPFQTAG